MRFPAAPELTKTSHELIPVVEIGSSQAPVAISKSTDHGAGEIYGPFSVTEILPASPAVVKAAR
jgi:predicted deacylase